MKTAFMVGYSLLSVGLFAIASLTLWYMVYAWRNPAALEATRFIDRLDSPELSFSLVVPARHEERVLGQTLAQLAKIDHPDFEVIAVVGSDDPGTRVVAEQAAWQYPDRIRVLVDESWPKSKPRALNAALPLCRGEIVGVIDAEDEVNPALLRNVDSCFRANEAHVVQGGVQLMNFQSSWFSVRNVLEYYFWFKSRLHFHADHNFVPLGGNTVFIRARLLRAVGGWDPNCLAEDCDLGVRLSSLGARIVVAYDPELVTREETPPTLTSLFKQRTRWNQGFLQVLRKGAWRRIPSRRQRLLAWWTLAMPFVQAVSAMAIPFSVATILIAKLPVAVVLLSLLPLLLTIMTVAIEMAGLWEFSATYRMTVRTRDYVRLVAGTFAYQLVLGGAAVRAVLREYRGERGWEKTAHTGAHRHEVEQLERRQVPA